MGCKRENGVWRWTSWMMTMWGVYVGDCVGKMRFRNGTWDDILRMYVFRG